MKLIKHGGRPGYPVTYSVADMTPTDLGFIQLALIEQGQEALATDKVWEPAKNIRSKTMAGWNAARKLEGELNDQSQEEAASIGLEVDSEH